MSRSTPTRLPSGVTNAYKAEVLGQFNLPNPFNSHVMTDDFDWIGATGVKYTITAPNSGTLANAAGDGGRILFTTGATSGNLVGIQPPAANFSLTLGRRAWFAARFQLAALSVPSWVAGLGQITSTPGTITAGIVFQKATGSTDIFLRHYHASVATLELAIPSSVFAPVAGQDFDLGFYVSEKGYLQAFARTVANGGLFGFEQTASVERQAIRGGQIPLLSSTDLAPTLAVITNATAAATLNADFWMAAKERA